MTTPSLAAGLMMLMMMVYCCNAMPHALYAPISCCNEFSTGKVPANKIISVFKTHSSCREPAFVVGTAKGKQLCVSRNAEWAQTAFRQQVSEGE